jgi:hypothetical protein
MEQQNMSGKIPLIIILANISLFLFLVAKNKSWRCAVWAVQFFNANSTHPSCLQDFFGDAS